jgi:hypothetical protein
MTRGRTTRDELDPGLFGHAHAQLELRDGEAHVKRGRGGARASLNLLHRDGVDSVGASEQDLVRPAAWRKRLIALSKTHKQRIIRHCNARKACIRNSQSIERERSVQNCEHQRVRVAGGGSHVVRLGGGGADGGCGSCCCGCGALQDRPVDGEVALDEGFLEDRREVEALRVAGVGTVPEQGEPFVLRGTGLREQVAEEVLGRGADLLRSFGESENGGREPPRGGCPCASP